MDWKNYIGDRLIADAGDFFVIVPKEKSAAQPLFCGVCSGIMRTSLDEDAYKKFTCCDSCATLWAYPNRDRWILGWRPSEDEVRNKYGERHT